jgi:hypothetical protein
MSSKWTSRILITLALLLAGCASAPPRLTKHVRGQFPHPSIPTTYVLGRDGQIIETFKGALIGPENQAALQAAILKGLGPNAEGASTVEEVESPPTP